MKGKLQVRKQQLVRDAIKDAALELFTAKGFDATTVEEVALTAGVSRRSFFRYFATKDDLLAQSVTNFGDVLVSAIAACPDSHTPFEVVRETVLSGVRHTASQEKATRQTIAISQRSISARQAYASRMVEVEDCVSTAYAQRFKSPSKYDMKSRLLAHLTISVISVAITAWFTGEYQELESSAERVLSSLTLLACDTPGFVLAGDGTSVGRSLENASRQ